MFKCHDLIYCFEIDGTLIDNMPYNSKNIFTRNYKLLKSKCVFNPVKYDIRWCIVTNHPAVDYATIRLCCFKNCMVPSQIITSNTFKQNSNIEECAQRKSCFFKSVSTLKQK